MCRRSASRASPVFFSPLSRTARTSEQSRSCHVSSRSAPRRSAGVSPAHPPRRSRVCARARRRRATSARARVDPPPLPPVPPAARPATADSSCVPLRATSARLSQSSRSWARSHRGQYQSSSGTAASGGSRHAQWNSPSHASHRSTGPAAMSPPHTAHPSSHATLGSAASSPPSSGSSAPSTDTLPSFPRPSGRPRRSALSMRVDTACGVLRSGAPAAKSSSPHSAASARAIASPPPAPALPPKLPPAPPEPSDPSRRFATA
mmetsp:Transcript_24708/g.61581  ORF Transcript_24708/g.61581 Transcript_24708/m.61581 type:complete len:262 (-) Transcript_24708:19-804(-)